MVEAEVVFISCGCNRAVKAAAWGPCNLVAFGSHNAVAIFCPLRAQIVQTLPGHKDLVNCVEWLPKNQAHSEDGVGSEVQYLLSGSADGITILWRYDQRKNKWRKEMQLPNSHDKAVSSISGVMLSSHEAVFATSSSDCTVHLWNIILPSEAEDGCKLLFLQSISTGSRAVVTVSLALLPTAAHNILLAMGGLDNNIRLFCGARNGQFALACVLKGHQDWVRSLDFSQAVMDGDKKAIYLASSGQDKFIRIWKVSPKIHGDETGANDGSKGQSFSIKMYIEGPIFKVGSNLWQASVESVLIGHDDWVYSVQWQPPRLEWTENSAGMQAKIVQPMSILSASMDRTMMIWRPDVTADLWVNDVTVGELGHTALGFYGGSWSQSGDAILAHSFGGSFHLWKNVGQQISNWQPQLVPSGHSNSVSDVAWAKNGHFLLSTSHDQTTRLFASWDWGKMEEKQQKYSWHEIARPQVHGHDLNCIAVVKGVGNHQFVSGAEEKVARVFEAPAAFVKSLENVEGYIEYIRDGSFQADDIKVLGANMSALGLSQKPIYSSGDPSSKGVVSSDAESIDTIPDASPMVLTKPPIEEHLGWNTLWPETHKLYGHGNELFSMCSDHHGRLLATACKAQSSNAAEIWLWEIGSWKAVGQLCSHTLTVTQMEFSHNDKFLLSVSRDRNFSIFRIKGRKENEWIPSGNTNAELVYEFLYKVEAHKRIIWTCSWSPCDKFFVTGSRDKSVKIWGIQDDAGDYKDKPIEILPLFKTSVTAVAWSPHRLVNAYMVAVGMEDGCLEIWKCEPIFTRDTGKIERFKSCVLIQLNAFSCHVASVNRLAWNAKPSCHRYAYDEDAVEHIELASCGADHAVRLFSFKSLDLTT